MIRAKFLYYSLLYLESVFIKTLAIALLTRLATCTNFELCIVVESSHKQHNTTLTKNMSYVEPIVEAAIIEATEEIVAAISEDAMEISECTAGNSKKGENRNVFPKISKDVIVKGVVVKTHPFLEGKCESELIFVKLLAVEKPFLAPHGSGKKTWADFIALVNQQVDENNAPVFAQAPMTERFAKERIKDYFSFVKSRIASTPFRSGTDDEEPPCELLQIVEDLYEQKTSFENDANDKKNMAVKNKKDSDALRAVSLSGKVPRPPPGDDDATFILNLQSNVETPNVTSAVMVDPNTSKRGSSMRPQGPSMDSLFVLEGQYKLRLDTQLQKEQNKKVKLEMALKRDEEKKKEREERRKQKEFDREEQRKDKELEREKNKLFLEALLALTKQKDH